MINMNVKVNGKTIRLPFHLACALPRPTDNAPYITSLSTMQLHGYLQDVAASQRHIAPNTF
jgi:hypothetical protein